MTTDDTTTLVLLAVDDRQGYAPDQVSRTMTLGDLAFALEEAIEKFGPDARIVTRDTGSYGAIFGGIDQYRDTFTAAGAEDEDEEDYS